MLAAAPTEENAYSQFFHEVSVWMQVFGSVNRTGGSKKTDSSRTLRVLRALAVKVFVRSEKPFNRQDREETGAKFAMETLAARSSLHVIQPCRFTSIGMSDDPHRISGAQLDLLEDLPR